MTEQTNYATGVDPEAFARSVAQTKDEHLAEGLRGPLRDEVFGEIFRRMEEHYEGGDGTDALVRFRIGGRPDGEYDRYDVTIADGTCSVSREPSDRRPRLTITVGDVEFLKLATGNANGPELFLRRKLKLKGDLPFAASLPGLFRIPKSS